MENLTNRFRNIENMSQNWGWFFGLALLLILLGAVTIGTSAYGTVFSIMLFGVFVIAAGIIEILQAFMARYWWGLFVSLLLGVLFIVIGFFCVTAPEETATKTTLWIAGFCIVAGLLLILAAALMRFEDWKWMVFCGAVIFLLGMFIYFEWPASGLWFIGLVVGIDMIMSGWCWLRLSLSDRPTNRTP